MQSVENVGNLFSRVRVRGKINIKSLARKLRKHPTDAENLLWKHLRAKRLNGYKFRRQHVIEPYIVDFFCMETGLIVEVDGGQHDEKREYDNERTAFLESRGYRVIRFWNNEILDDIDIVLERIMKILDDPSPQPSPEGRGGDC